jgi:hypothetical protein
VALIVQDFKVFVFVFKDGCGLSLDVQGGVCKWRSAELKRNLFFVIAVNVAITTGPNEIANLQIALLRHHVSQQGVACNVEGHAQEDIGAALVQLATEFAFAAFYQGWCHIKLKERMARHERHFGKFGHVPSTDYDAA